MKKSKLLLLTALGAALMSSLAFADQTYPVNATATVKAKAEPYWLLVDGEKKDAIDFDFATVTVGDTSTVKHDLTVNSIASRGQATFTASLAQTTLTGDAGDVKFTLDKGDEMNYQKALVAEFTAKAAGDFKGKTELTIHSY